MRLQMRAWTLLQSYLGARWRFTRLRGDALVRFQDRRARAAVEFARRHSPFFRSHYGERDACEWRDFPTVDKAAMMANFDAYTTRGVSLAEVMPLALEGELEGGGPPTWRRLTIGLSSGTSGHRGIFVADERERMTWAGTILARMLPAWPPRGYRVALLLRANNRLYDSVRSRWIDLRFWNIMTPIDELSTGLGEFAPHVLIGPPSLLVRIAERTSALRPRQVFSVAEVLDPEDEAIIERGFGQRVGQVYQSTEGLLAVSCPAGSLHIQEDLVAVQLEPVHENCAGQDEARLTPIVTDLWRRVQPILRYRLNDLVTLQSGSCACGSAFRRLRRIEGRCDDVCRLIGRDGAAKLIYPDVVRRMILLADPRIEDYRVEQPSPGEFLVHVRSNGPLGPISESLIASAARIAASYDCLPPKLTIDKDLENDRSAKQRRIRAFHR